MLSWFLYVQRGMRSLTHFDICFPQEVYYSAGSTSKPEKVLSHFLCPYWKFIQCEPIHSERAVERESALWAFRVHARAVLCQQREGRGGWQKRKIQPQVDTISQKQIAFFIPVFLSAPLLFLLLLICLIFFCFKGKIFVNSFIFSWGVTFLDQLIFGSKTASGFNLRGLYYQKRMFSACLPVTSPSRACMHVVLMKDYSLMFSIKSGVSQRRREGENIKGLQRRRQKLTTG